MRRLAIWLGFLGVLAAGPRAQAGGCPPCTGPAECAGGFCVHHNAADIGCGSIVQTCCPGQACRIDPNGRPSCENLATCTVVGGNPTVDAGTSTVDAAGAADGAATSDGGGKGGDSSGCSCRAGAGATSGATPLVLMGLLAVALGWRRRS